MIASRSVILRTNSVPEKVVQKIETRVLCSTTFSPENRAVYEIMWENMVEPDRPHMTIWRMRNACWIIKAKNTHSERVTLIAFPRQQWLGERIWMLRYSYIACRVLHPNFIIFSPRRNGPQVGQGLLIIEASRLHSDTPHSVGLLWTSDQPVAEISTWQHTTLTEESQPCPWGVRKRKNPQDKKNEVGGTWDT